MKITFHETTGRLYLTAHTAQEHYDLGRLTVAIGVDHCSVSQAGEAKDITLGLPIERLIAAVLKAKDP